MGKRKQPQLFKFNVHPDQKMKFLKFFLYIICFFTLITVVSCANRKSPTGGEKDVKGPEIVLSVPENKTTNFNGDKIFFEFSEFIKEDNLAQKAIISPALDSTFKSKIVKKKLYLTFHKKFKENTTYTINLGEGIKDITEGNAGNNLKFIFSTGPHLDSLNISGKIISLETGKPVKDALVGLYNANDTITPFNGKPIYISRTSAEGNFLLENLSKNEYLIYSFVDKNRDLKYSDPSEHIGFLEDTIRLDSSITNLAIPIQKFDLRKLKAIRSASEKDLVSIEFNKGITDINLTFPKDSSNKVLYTFNDTKNKISIFNTINKYDSIPVHIVAKDSFDIRLDTTFNVLFGAEEIKKQVKRDRQEETKESNTFSVKVNPSNRNILTTKELEVISELPISEYDIKGIYFYRDSLTTYPLESKDILWNNNVTSFKIEKDIPFRDTIFFRIDSLTLTDVKKKTAALVNLLLLKKKSEKYSSIGGNVEISANDFILQLSRKENKNIQELRNSKTFKFDYLEPGTYSLKVLVDENKNGKWDRGSLEKRIEPERIIFYTISDNKGNPTNEIVLKANWELLENTIKE